MKADREADKNCEDEPKRMEKLLMDFCREKAGIKEPQDDENLDSAEMVLTMQRHGQKHGGC